MLDARALPFKDGEFDCVVTSELFSHMKFNDAQKAANEIKRVAGRYIFTMERYVFDGEHPEPHVFSWDINKFFRLKVLERKIINNGIVGTVLEKS
jgi:ubiquinone/menaquinone biosynthesis C-methylase UbiE